MQFDPYEYTSIILPGSVLVFAASLLSPEVKALLGEDGVSIGGLGLFVLASFVIGHAVQAFGNLVETVGSGIYGPGRSDLLLSPRQDLIATAQRERLKTSLARRAGVDLDLIAPREWRSVRREMYSNVQAAGRAARVDAFNRTYGLQRGLAAGLILAAIVTPLAAESPLPATGALLLGACLALYRMRRFSDHYIRELVVEYLSTSKAADGEKSIPVGSRTSAAASSSEVAPSRQDDPDHG